MKGPAAIGSAPLRRRRRVAVLLLATLTALAGAGTAAGGLELRRVQVDGVERSYRYHRPEPRPAGRVPLLLVFHGGLGDGTKIARQTGFNRLADREGFAVAYPDARGYWQDGRATTGSAETDIRFVRKIVRELQASGRIDPLRVYAAGASNGGMFTLRLACEATDVLAGAAPVLASFPVGYLARCRPARPLPVLFINGTEDGFIPWQGGQIRKGRRRGAGGEVVAVPASVEFWRSRNGCRREPLVRRLPDRDPADGTRVSEIRYLGCTDSATVELIRVEGGGHTWPGTPNPPPPFIAAIMGRVSRDINASELIWDFLRRHAKAPATKQ